MSLEPRKTSMRQPQYQDGLICHHQQQSARTFFSFFSSFSSVCSFFVCGHGIIIALVEDLESTAWSWLKSTQRRNCFICQAQAPSDDSKPFPLNAIIIVTLVRLSAPTPDLCATRPPVPRLLPNSLSLSAIGSSPLALFFSPLAPTQTLHYRLLSRFGMSPICTSVAALRLPAVATSLFLKSTRPRGGCMWPAGWASNPVGCVSVCRIDPAPQCCWVGRARRRKCTECT